MLNRGMKMKMKSMDIEKLDKCAQCENGHLRPGRSELERTIAGVRFIASISSRICDSCGINNYSAEIIKNFEVAAARQLADAGVVSGVTIKFLRKVAGLNGKELAELLGVRPETVSRWEQDKGTIDTASLAVLRQLVLEHARGSDETMRYLRGLRQTQPRPLVFRLDLDRAASD